MSQQLDASEHLASIDWSTIPEPDDEGGIVSTDGRHITDSEGVYGCPQEPRSPGVSTMHDTSA